MTWQRWTLIGAGLLAGLLVLGYALGWPPFSDDAPPENAQPAAVADPPPTTTEPPPPTTTTRSFLDPPPQPTSTTTTTVAPAAPADSSVPEAPDDGSDPESAEPGAAADGSEVPEEAPCWSVTEDGDVFSNFVLLENICALEDPALDGEAPDEGLLEGAVGEGLSEGAQGDPAPEAPDEQALAEGLLEGAQGDPAPEAPDEQALGEGLSGDGLGDPASGADLLDAVLGLGPLDDALGEGATEEPSMARVGWRCAVQTGRLEMFASTGEQPSLLPNDEAVVLLRFGSQDRPVVPSWTVREELDDEEEVEGTFIVYEGLWQPDPADDHDRAGLPVSETDHPVVGIQGGASKRLPEHELTTRRADFDRRQEHAQHAPHLVHAPNDIAEDALRSLRRQDGEEAVLHLSIGSAQVTFDVSGWEEHIAALDPCGAAP